MSKVKHKATNNFVAFLAKVSQKQTDYKMLKYVIK
ncbi:hypothetical protein ACSSV5_000794 [Psychroflexus sp. MBR-150]|jgi:hypothetical protein